MRKLKRKNPNKQREGLDDDDLSPMKEAERAANETSKVDETDWGLRAECSCPWRRTRLVKRASAPRLPVKGRMHRSACGAGDDAVAPPRHQSDRAEEPVTIRDTTNDDSLDLLKEQMPSQTSMQVRDHKSAFCSGRESSLGYEVYEHNSECQG